MIRMLVPKNPSDNRKYLSQWYFPEKPIDRPYVELEESVDNWPGYFALNDDLHYFMKEYNIRYSLAKDIGEDETRLRSAAGNPCPCAWDVPDGFPVSALASFHAFNASAVRDRGEFLSRRDFIRKEQDCFDGYFDCGRHERGIRFLAVRPVRFCAGAVFRSLGFADYARDIGEVP